jgi:MoxR-like ATPase
MNIIKLKKEDDLKTYKPSRALKTIALIAQSLCKPLLLAGKPGAGKTQFAHWLAYTNRNLFNEKAFCFNTKSTSISTDLFYYYDAVSHFRDKENLKEAADFIELTALGKAIICAKGVKSFSNLKMQKIIKNSSLENNVKQKNIVLIDEVDKAPRDFPNDLLHEIDTLSFTIKEINETIELADSEKENILIVLTSNDEKNLPDAFLRRCLYHYIEFPSNERLLEIIANKLSIDEARTKIDINNRLNFFKIILDSTVVEKKPSTAECIDWINYLYKNNLLDKDVHENENNFELSLSILLKKKDDLDEAIKLYKNI